MIETASLVGDPQVRNLGTVAGSLVHCDPSGDWGSCILALRANLKVLGPLGYRAIRADDFFEDTFQSALEPNEILTEIEVPIPRPRAGGSYVKFERKAGDFASVGVAAQISMEADSTCAYVGIGLTSVARTNIRAKKAEAVLLGKELSDESIKKAARAASEESGPVSDPVRGSAEYKRAMVEVFAERAVKLALERSRERK